WLKRHIDTDASLGEVCDKLTAIGLEVEGVEDRSEELMPFIVAQIVSAEKHPNADKLQLCSVNTGKEKLQIVCGAPNARAGLKVVLARPGDVIPINGEALKKGLIRGIESCGMMCSAQELMLGEDSHGIIEVQEDAPLGVSYASYAGLNDPVIEINLTPNRGDCAGVRGVARDLVAAGMGKLKELKIDSFKGKEKSRINVKLDFHADKKNDCSLFTGRLVRNIKNGPSPEWMQKYLRAIGLRPISALVDITNFITFDCARPMHVFDADKVNGNLRVHSSKGGEAFNALNAKIYALEPGMTVISDDRGILSLAGIMGGEGSGCELDTKNVFIESAMFDAARTAKTGQALQISSDARYRFERGVDPAFVVSGSDLALQLVLECCSTKDTVVSEMVVVGEATAPERAIDYDPRQCLQRIGVDVSAAEQKKILTDLGFKVEDKKQKFVITVPSWRPDVSGIADITEEVIRIKGFECIPALSLPNPSAVTSSAVNREDLRAGQIRRSLAAQGLMEAVTWSFMSQPLAEFFAEINPSLKLINPISSDLDVMRPSIMGNLLLAAKRNADRGFADVGLFEVGPTYHNATPEGQVMMAASLRLGSTSRHWADKARAFDAFDAKADAVAALSAAGAPVASLQVTADAPSWYHPGRSGCLRLGPMVLGYFGEIHPRLMAAADAPGRAVGCELFISAIPQPRSSGCARPLLKMETLQPVSRDFAFIVDEKIVAEKIIRAVKGADKNLVRDVTVFDVYSGDRIEDGKKSIALNVILQPQDHTLTDVEIEGVSALITAAASKLGAILRG
ncbi:MAG: phenylalanine--tRNA ligase subunit beta, partial [Alphaproteobacteria bacterium]|nr:phenylalanine--tRNA ligase subunit beta [Alphaproteobacteria bacterium]